MARRHLFALLCVTLMAASGPAIAQRSLFDQPIDQPATPAPAAPAPAAPAPAAPAPKAPAPRNAAAPKVAAPAGDAPAGEAPAKPKPKRKPAPKGPVPARVLTITNASASTLTALEVSQDGKGTKLTKPLKANGKTSLKLPAFKACEATVAYSFEGAGQPISSEIDICKDKSLRLTDG